MNTDYTVEQLVPHSGKMSLLSHISEHGDNWLRAKVEISSESVFADATGVPAYVGLEYLAQAIGAFAGLRERLKGEQPKVGFLLGSRKYTCSTDYFPVGSTLDLLFEEEMQGENGLSVFNGTLTAPGISAQARLNVFQPQNAEQFLNEGTL